MALTWADCALTPILVRGCCPPFQTLVSRGTSPFGHAVVTVTRLSAGDAFNVIPDEVKLGGTVRSSSDEDMQVGFPCLVPNKATDLY